ncbi:MAG: MarR family winged helix-turn-helix transcriptional regulator [Candidatus Dormibacteria bacterium]
MAGGASGETAPGPAPAPILGDDQEVAQGLSEDLGFLVGRVHRKLRTNWERSIADLGLSAPQAAAVRAVVQQPGAAIRGLARVLATDPMNARRLTLDLERMGLVEVLASHRDRRAKGVWPTARGAALAGQIDKRATDQRQRLVSGLGANSYRSLVELLEQLAEVGQAPDCD